MKILILKYFGVIIYSTILTHFGIMVNQESPRPPEQIFYFFLSMTFIPETALILSSGFRSWIKQGVENADGRLNKSDLKDMLILYGSLWSLRVFLFMSWVKIFYGIEIEYWFYITPLIGSFGISGLPVLKALMKK